MDEWLAETSVIPEILNGRERCNVTASVWCSKLRYKHASFGYMLWVKCGFYFTSDENLFNHGAASGFGREESSGGTRGGHGGANAPPVRGFAPPLAPPVRMGFFFFFYFFFFFFFFTYVVSHTSHQFKINISIWCNISFYKQSDPSALYSL